MLHLTAFSYGKFKLKKNTYTQPSNLTSQPLFKELNPIKGINLSKKNPECLYLHSPEH